MEMEWKDIPTIQWYGERGIVNAIVTHIGRQSTEDARLSAIKSFLGAIIWAKGKGPDWIDSISDFKMVVELGLSQFGDPDLIIICKTKKNGEDKTYCFFVEAKAVPYRKSKMSNKEGMGKGKYGFNSSINGQLSLKYRFAIALNNWDENVCEENNRKSLSEPKEMGSLYKEELKDNIDRRKIAKKKILDNILEPLGLNNLDAENFYFVAWTWDNDEHIFFKDKEVWNSNGFPLFLKTDPSKMEMRLGWLGYKNLEERLELESSKEYMAARITMKDNNEPDKDNEYYTADKVSLQKWKVFNDNIASLSDNIYAEFEKDKEVTTEKLDGSYSIKYNGRTVAKIIPQHEYTFVGFRLGLDDIVWPKTSYDEHESAVINIHGVFFKGIKFFPNKANIEKVKIFINDCLDDV